MTEKSRKPGRFTKQEIIELFPEDPSGPWRNVIAYTCFQIVAYMGMRRSEVLALKWGKVDFENRRIIVDSAFKGRGDKTTKFGTGVIGKTKTDKDRHPPLPEKLAGTLRKLHDESIRTDPDDFVICENDGESKGYTWWQKHFRHAMKKAALDYEKRNLKPHSLRHTCNSLLLDSGKNADKIRAYCGWSQEKTQKGYTELESEKF